LLSIRINGIDRTSGLIEKSVSISEAVNERSVAQISLISKAGHYRPDVGETVEIFDGNDLVFAGSIDDLPEYIADGTDVLVYQGIPVVDLHQAADRRLVAESFENQTAGFIVKTILDGYLADEGVTAGTIQEGVIVSKAVFNYIPASECFDELSELTGLQWRINPDRTLDFFDRATFTGTPVHDQSGIKNLRVKKSRQQYRNRQFLRAGQDVSAVQTRTFKGDGETQIFTVDLALAKVPVVKVNDTIQTVGIRGLDNDRQWYWQKNDKSVSQHKDAPKLQVTDILTIEFQGFYPIVIVADSTSEIASRKAVEGGSGIYESMEEKRSIDTKDSALAFTEGLLRRFANIQVQVIFDTFTRYRAGELVDVDLPSHGIKEQMLVADVRVQDTGAADHRLTYTVRLVSGESFGGWVQFFRKLADKNKTFVIRENEMVIRMSAYSDVFIVPDITDDMDFKLHQYHICSETAFCGAEVIM
jgi:hypothetical protein